MASDKLFVVNGPNVVRDSFDGEVVIVSLDTGNYYSLQGSAAAVWDQIEQAASLNQLLQNLNSRYSGSPEGIRESTMTFLNELVAERLVSERAVDRIEAPGDGATTEAAEPFVAPALAKFSDMQELLLLDPIHDVDETGWPAARAAAGQ